MLLLLLITKPCPTLCDPRDCSAPGFPALHCLQSLLRLISVEWMVPSNHPPVAPFSSCPQSFPASGAFPVSLLFASGGQSTGAQYAGLEVSAACLRNGEVVQFQRKFAIKRLKRKQNKKLKKKQKKMLES